MNKIQPPKTLEVALVPMNSQGDPESNWAICKEKIRQYFNQGGLARAGSAQGTRWLCLPEMFLSMGQPLKHKSTAKFFLQTVLPEIQELCLQNQAVIFAGTVPYFAESTKELPFNRLYVIDQKGEVAGIYDKNHLFHLRSSVGKPTHDETRVFSPGSALTTLTLDGWRVGLAICYDLRFPSHFLKMLAQGPVLDVIVIPSAFTYRTGEAHWQLLLRSLAVTMQAYVLACNQVGEHGDGKRSFGHSLVVDPWGDVMSDSGQSLETLHAILSKERIETVRQQLPSVAALSHAAKLGL